MTEGGGVHFILHRHFDRLNKIQFSIYQGVHPLAKVEFKDFSRAFKALFLQ